MAIMKKAPVKAFLCFDQTAFGSSRFFQIWQLLNSDGPLCPLPAPQVSEMSARIERMRRQQVHVDEIKRLCHVPIRD